MQAQGFRNFNLHFNIPYYVLRTEEKLRRDSRIRTNGKPLRDSWELPSLSEDVQTAASTGMVDCVYEAHIAVAVTGIDNWVWTAYGFVDTYFEAEDSVESYDQLNGEYGGRADPFSCGVLDSDRPIPTPRAYFLRVVEIRILGVVREWSAIVRRMETDIREYVYASNWQCFSLCA